MFINCCRSILKKIFVILLGLGLFLNPNNALAGTMTADFNVDRPGGDYRYVDLDQPCASLCQKECDRDKKCLAYSYNRPGIQGPKARCWLKNTVPERVIQGDPSCCVSGIQLNPAPPNCPSPDDDPQGSFCCIHHNDPPICRRSPRL